MVEPKIHTFIVVGSTPIFVIMFHFLKLYLAYVNTKDKFKNYFIFIIQTIVSNLLSLQYYSWLVLEFIITVLDDFINFTFRFGLFILFNYKHIIIFLHNNYKTKLNINTHTVIVWYIFITNVDNSLLTMSIFF